MKNNLRKLLCVVLVFVLCLSLAGCSSDPNCGTYIGKSIELGEKSYDIKDALSNGASLELKDGAICKLNLDGDEYTGTFTTEDAKVTIKLKETESVGTISDGVLSIDLLGKGMVIKFIKQ